MGYMDSNDTLFQDSGLLLGLKIFLDENRVIAGLIAILSEKGAKK